MRFASSTIAALPLLALSIAGCGAAPSKAATPNPNASPPAGSNVVSPSSGTSSTTSPPSTSGSSSTSPASNPASPPPPTPPPAPAPDPAPTPPAGTTVSNIEQMSGWESCDTCTGGGQIAFSMAQSLNYPQPGTTQFSIGQGSPWAGALWWKRLGNDSNPSHFVLTLDQYIENPAVSFGIEYDANQIIDGNWYDFATQCSFGYGIWQVWDDANQHWVPTSVPCARPAPSTHVQVRLEFQRLNGQAIFVSIGTDGNIVPLNMAFNPQPSAGLNGDFGVHIQLNTNGNPDPYSVWVHDMALNYW